MSLQYRGNTLFLIVKVWDIYISCRYILLQKKLDLKVVKLYPLHSQGSFVFVHSIRIISLKMSDSTKERFYFIQNKFIWNYFYTIGDYNKYLNTIRGLIGRCNGYFGRWLYFNPSGFRYDPFLFCGWRTARWKSVVSYFKKLMFKVTESCRIAGIKR